MFIISDRPDHWSVGFLFFILRLHPKSPHRNLNDFSTVSMYLNCARVEFSDCSVFFLFFFRRPNRKWREREEEIYWPKS